MGGITDAVGGFLKDTLGDTLGTVVGVLLSPFTLGVDFLVDFGFGLLEGDTSSDSTINEARGRLLNVRSAVESRRTAYGRVKVGGLISFIEVTGTDNQYLHIIQILSEGAIRGPQTFFVDDRPIYPSTLDGSGEITEAPFLDADGNSLIRIQWHTGEFGQTANPALVSEVTAWTSAHQGDSIAYVYYRFKFDREKFAGIPRVACEFKGRKVIEERGAASPIAPAYTANAAIILLDWLKSPEGLEISPQDIDQAAFIAAANTCDEFVDGVSDAKNKLDVSAVDVTNNLWEFDVDVCPFLDGDQVNVSTTGALPTGVSAATDYYVFVIEPFVVKDDDGSVVRRPKISLHTSNPGGVQSVYNSLSGQITFSDSGSGTHTIERMAQARYTADGVVLHNKNPGTVKQEIESATAGKLVFTGGKWTVLAGGYVAPTIELDDDDIRGAISIETRHSQASRFNAVKGTYISPLNNYSPTDYPAFESATFLADDLGRKLFTDLALPFTKSPAAATRIAKIKLLRHRQEIGVKLRCKLSAWQVRAGDRVQITNTEMGWTQKVFDVVSVVLAADQKSNAYVGIDLELRETASTVFDWNAGADESPVDPAPNTNLPNPFFVPPPSNLVLASGDAESFVRSDGTIFTNIELTWTVPTSLFVQSGGRIEIQFKRSAGSTWTDSTPASGDSTNSAILNVENGINYDVRIRAISNIGRSSAYLTVSNHEVGGKTTVPGPATTFGVSTDAVGVRVFRWTNILPDADLAGYKIRFFIGSGQTNWDLMTDLNEGLLTSSPWETNELSAGTYSFGIRAQDTSGNLSTGVFIDATLPDQNLSNSLSFVNEKANGWPGTKTNCGVGSGGNLTATASGTIGDLPATIGALPADIASLGGNFPAFIQYVTPEVDLGGDVNFQPIATLISNGGETLEMQVGSDVDGSADGPESPSNPWQPLARITGRYVRIRAHVEDTGSPSIQLIMSGLQWLLDAPITVEVFDDVDTSSEAASWFESLAAGHFRIASRDALSAVTIGKLALNNVGAGWTWEVIDKQASIASGDVAVEFKVYNASSVLADAVVDVELRGPKA